MVLVSSTGRRFCLMVRDRRMRVSGRNVIVLILRFVIRFCRAMYRYGRLGLIWSLVDGCRFEFSRLLILRILLNRWMVRMRVIVGQSNR